MSRFKEALTLATILSGAKFDTRLKAPLAVKPALVITKADGSLPID
ncbi:MAG: hypothetical protein AAGL97_02105 [Pseudomonadota bacterium]